MYWYNNDAPITNLIFIPFLYALLHVSTKVALLCLFLLLLLFGICVAPRWYRAIKSQNSNCMIWLLFGATMRDFLPFSNEHSFCCFCFANSIGFQCFCQLAIAISHLLFSHNLKTLSFLINWWDLKLHLKRISAKYAVTLKYIMANNFTYYPQMYSDVLWKLFGRVAKCSENSAEKFKQGFLSFTTFKCAQKSSLSPV